MSLSMYDISVPVFEQILGAMSGVLDKAGAHYAARKIDPANVLATRLYPDMFTFGRQIQQASDHAKNASAKLAQVEAPTFENTENNFDELKARIGKSLDFLKTLKPSQFEGSENRKITVATRARTMEFENGRVFLLTFTLPNFYFHCTTAYDILRHNGVEIGKRDFLGTR